MTSHNRDHSLAGSDFGDGGWGVHWDDQEYVLALAEYTMSVLTKWFRGAPNSIADPWRKPLPAVEHPEEAYDLTEDGRLWVAEDERNFGRTPYKDGDSIDWLHEGATERARQHVLHDHRGLRRILIPSIDAAKGWFVVVATGIGIGVIGAWLDILAKFLGDLREGKANWYKLLTVFSIDTPAFVRPMLVWLFL
jgi:hypothetical protein